MTALIFVLYSLVGTWQYVGFHYEGRDYPNPNPDLTLLFTFNADGTSHLYWSRKNESGFCERRGIYRLDGDLLWQKTTWVNPENDRSCAMDSDMQPDRETTTTIRLQEDKLAFVLHLDDQEFLYKLERVPLNLSQVATH